MKLAKLDYAGAQIMAEVVRQEDLAGAWGAVTANADSLQLTGLIAGSSASVSAREPRKSRRSRKGRAPLTVSSHETLTDLKMRIYQALDVHPGNALVGDCLQARLWW